MAKGANNLGVIVALVVFGAIIGRCSTDTSPRAADPTPVAAFGASSENTTLKYVTANALNCRSRPQTSARVLSKFGRAEAVYVKETSSGWSLIERTAADCWASSQHLNDYPPPARVTPSPLYSSPSRSTPARTSKPRQYYDGNCPCSGRNVCIGPRGGRYCITSGGNKRYGV